MARDPLQKSVRFVKGVGPSRAEKLSRLGVHTVGDLLFHFPRAYQDLGDIRPIAQLTANTIQTAKGEVVGIEGKRLADGRSIVSIVLAEGKSCLEGVWFNQPYLSSRFRHGQHVAFSGKPRWYRDHWQMSNPQVHVSDEAVVAKQPGIVPIYPLTENVKGEHLSAVIRQALEQFVHEVPEILPEDIRRERELPEKRQALRAIHAPADLDKAEAARRRFVYEDLLLLQIALAIRRRELRDRMQAPILMVTKTIDRRIRDLFPFQLTADQDRAVNDICQDLAAPRPMQRLLQADVGAGKTAVAVYALLVTVANKHQAILMAPTEVLARQHWDTLDAYLANSRVRRILLTGGLSRSQRHQALVDIRSGQMDLVIGTQALLERDLRLPKLGLVIVDEQHKFGVNQRARIRRLGLDPHYLVMTATPIPRTIALTLFGDLDTSLIRELPPGRQPVNTRWVREGERERVYEEIRRGLTGGRQCYVVCPLVKESASRDLKTAEATNDVLRHGAFQDFQVGLLHGAMTEADKERIMRQFRTGKIQVLVSTLIIEVGVDVPKATLMIVEHGERFGISQLHQLRGRVSRGPWPGYCYIFGEPSGEEARQRLRIVTRVTDGFALAEHDFRLRGTGELFGTRQHGLGELAGGDWTRDSDLLRLARRDAISLVAKDAGLRSQENEKLRQAVITRFGASLDLPTIG
jgi:ATP-dependent DNA helicase RecG